MLRFRHLIAAAVVLSPTLAMAHAGHLHHETMSMGEALASGWLHPLTGLDHLLAMVGLGLWISAGRMKEQLWIAGSFGAAMMLGAVAGVAGLVVPGVELMIALSVLALGCLAAAGKGYRFSVGIAVASCFALFHGFAHGTEMGAASAPAYFTGFLAASSMLVLGSALLAGMAREQGLAILRPAGTMIAAAGLVFLTGLI